MSKLDEYVKDGIFTVLIKPDSLDYDIRAIERYCKVLGINPKDLTKELTQFIIK